MPELLSWSSDSTSPLRADIDSLRRCITRASAYLAPASSAAWTASSAASNSLMPSTLGGAPAPGREVRGQSSPGKSLGATPKATSRRAHASSAEIAQRRSAPAVLATSSP